MQRTIHSSINTTAMLGNLYIGSVNIDNRIICKKCEVTTLGVGKYKLVQFAADLPEIKSFLDYNKLAGVLNNWANIKKEGIVEATIDGNSYKGSEIIVDGYEVYVDGKLATIKQAAAENTTENRSGPRP
jgi:hypothetical protein